MKEVVLGLLGLGNIGGGVWDLVREFGDEVAKRTGVKLRIKKALVLDVKIHGGKEVPDEVLTTNRDDILEDPEIQIVCEFLGGEQPAASMMLRALENGKSVVTANKMALSLHFDELRAMSQKTGAGLYYEASVGGAIPIINAIQSPLIANHIEQTAAGPGGAGPDGGRGRIRRGIQAEHRGVAGVPYAGEGAGYLPRGHHESERRGYRVRPGDGLCAEAAGDRQG